MKPLTDAVNNTRTGIQTVAGALLLLVIIGLGVRLMVRRGNNALAVAGGAVFIAAGAVLVMRPEWFADLLGGLGRMVTGG